MARASGHTRLSAWRAAAYYQLLFIRLSCEQLIVSHFNQLRCNFKTDTQDSVSRKPLGMLRATWVCESTLSTISLNDEILETTFKLRCFINISYRVCILPVRVTVTLYTDM